jgi:hypothetical protein
VRVLALLRRMPGWDATAVRRAEWLELKAEVLAYLAGEHRAVAAEADRYARAAREQAAVLRSGGAR